MKGIKKVILLLFICVCMTGLSFYSMQPDGSTKESREQILNNLYVHAGAIWKIFLDNSRRVL